MDVSVFEDAAQFGRRADVLLRRHPVEANVLATLVVRWTTAEPPAGSPRPLWLLAEDGGEAVGAAVHAPPYPPALTPMDDEAARAVADALLERVGSGEVPGVSGPAAPAKAFAERVAERSGRRAVVRLAEGVHVLGDLVPPRGVPGCAVLATREDVDLLHRWMVAFRDEAVPGEPASPREGVIRRVDAGGYLLWRDGSRPVSTAHLHPPSLGVARIGPVYTPPEHRRHGYAAAVTASAAQRLLASGAERVMLFTDLTNATSNGVYARIGFRRVADASLWVLTHRAGG